MQTTFRPPSIRSLRRSLWLVVVTLTVAGLMLLAGCSGSNDQTSASPSASRSGSAQPSASQSPSASQTPSATKKPSIKPSKNLDKISVSSAFGKKPKIKVDKPWAINKTQSKVLHSGDGHKVHKSGSVMVNYTGVDGRTGKTFDTNFKKKGAKPEPVALRLDQTVAGFRKGLAGKQVGDQVLIAMTGKDGYDSAGGAPQQGIKVGDTLIFVVDITDASLEEATGKKVPAKSGLPAFAVSDGKPKIKMPKSDPPQKTTVQPLIKGTGRKIESGDTVTTKSVTALWKNGKIVDNSWKKPWAPGTQPQQQQQGQQQQKRLPAMSKAMAGQRIGSRLLIVWPPGTAYKSGDASQGIGRDDTVVMVIDILFSQPKR